MLTRHLLEVDVAAKTHGWKMILINWTHFFSHSLSWSWIEPDSLTYQISKRIFYYIKSNKWDTVHQFSPANFYQKNREFRRVLALFPVNAGYICIFALILHPLALFCVLSHGFTFLCNFTLFLEFINYSDRLTKLETFLLQTLKIKGWTF